jgi:hypothetical protein
MGDKTLSVVCEDIVIVYKEYPHPENRSDLLYVVKRDDTKNRGWIYPTFLDKIDRIHQYTATGAVFSNPPIAAGIGSLSSVSSMSSSVGSTSSTKRMIEDLRMDNCNLSIALSNTHRTVGGSFPVASSNNHHTVGGTRKKIRKKTVFKPPPPQRKSNGNAVHRTNHKYNPTEIIWMVNTKTGTVRDFDRIMHHHPVAYDLIEYLGSEDPGKGNVCLKTTELDVDESWNRVLHGFNRYIIHTSKLRVSDDKNTNSLFLNGIFINDCEPVTQLFDVNDQLVGYLYITGSILDFGKLMREYNHISGDEYDNTFGNERNVRAPLYCLYNQERNEFLFLAYKYNCPWMAIDNATRKTGKCAELLKKCIDRRKRRKINKK